MRKILLGMIFCLPASLFAQTGSGSAIDVLQEIEITELKNQVMYQLVLENLKKSYPAALETEVVRAPHSPLDGKGTIRVIENVKLKPELLLPLMIRSIQEQQKELEVQRRTIEQLQQQLGKLDTQAKSTAP